MELVEQLYLDEIDDWWKGKKDIAYGIDRDVDDMVPVALVKEKKTGTVYYIEPSPQNGALTDARVYTNLTPEEYQEKLDYINNLED